MRKSIITSIIMLTILAVPAFANITVRVDDFGPYQTGSGGEFTVKPIDWNPMGNYHANALYDGGFQTFCMEKSEGIARNTTYDVILNDRAVNGGNNNGPEVGSDPVSKGTAWLYYNFAKGTLLGYNYTDTTLRKQSADILQKTFWYLEDEITASEISDHSLLNMVAGVFGSESQAKENYTGSAVRVMNLYKQDGTFAQDQLVVVPAPGAILLGSIGTMLVGYMRRRRAL